ncbi:MAG: hypothetical protein P9M00_12680 [Candidatus Tritonobacter lacicola]|nr:hypothetical protein [Candidatus Tritonobacter lacicola]
MKYGPDRNAAFERFIKCFKLATAEIREIYILLPIDGSPSLKYRERVYCYELYHQLRVVMGDDFGYTLGGEVDKSAHPIMKGGFKPDLLVHTPGDMRGNLVVIEVKPVMAKRQDIEKDLKTLTSFRKQGRYHQAVYLIYGDDKKRLNKIRKMARELETKYQDHRIDLSLIMLFWHRVSGCAAEHIIW